MMMCRTEMLILLCGPWWCITIIASELYCFVLPSDAELCDEKQDQYPCFTGEGQCYSMSQRCNGLFDACTDGADEYGCKCFDLCRSLQVYFSLWFCFPAFPIRLWDAVVSHWLQNQVVRCHGVTLTSKSGCEMPWCHADFKIRLWDAVVSHWLQNQFVGCRGVTLTSKSLHPPSWESSTLFLVYISACVSFFILFVAPLCSHSFIVVSWLCLGQSVEKTNK